MSPSSFTLAERESIAKNVFPWLEKAPFSQLIEACFQVAVVLDGRRSALTETQEAAIREAAKEFQGGRT